MFHFYLWLVFQSKSVLPKVIFIYHHEKHLITMITTIHHLVEESITHITPNWQNTCKNNWNHFPLLIELSYDLESWCQTLLLLASQYYIWWSFGGDQQSITKSKRTLVLRLSCCQKKKKIIAFSRWSSSSNELVIELIWDEVSFSTKISFANTFDLQDSVLRSSKSKCYRVIQTKKYLRKFRFLRFKDIFLCWPKWRKSLFSAPYLVFHTRPSTFISPFGITYQFPFPTIPYIP